MLRRIQPEVRSSHLRNARTLLSIAGFARVHDRVRAIGADMERIGFVPLACRSDPLTGRLHGLVGHRHAALLGRG
jgi:hypothetical protein